MIDGQMLKKSNACNSFLLESRENPYCESYTGSKREKTVVREESVYSCRKCHISENKSRVRLERQGICRTHATRRKGIRLKIITSRKCLKIVRQCTSFIGREPCRRRSRTMCRSETRKSAQLLLKKKPGLEKN